MRGGLGKLSGKNAVATAGGDEPKGEAAALAAADPAGALVAHHGVSAQRHRQHRRVSAAAAVLRCPRTPVFKDQCSQYHYGAAVRHRH